MDLAKAKELADDILRLHRPDTPPATSEGMAHEQGKTKVVAAVPGGFGVRQPRRRQELYDYMHALASARREKGDAESRHMYDTIAYYQERDDIAEALGIDVGAEDWWDSNDQTKREKIMGRISVLRDLRSKSTPNIAHQPTPPSGH